MYFIELSVFKLSKLFPTMLKTRNISNFTRSNDAFYLVAGCYNMAEQKKKTKEDATRVRKEVGECDETLRE